MHDPSMSRARNREAMIRVHTAKLVHVRLLGFNPDWLAKPNWVNVQRLQALINERTKR